MSPADVTTGPLVAQPLRRLGSWIAERATPRVMRAAAVAFFSLVVLVTTAAALIRPEVAVPIHWGTLHPRGRHLGDWFTEPARRFAAHAAELAPDVDVRMLAPGESLAL